MGLLAGLFTTTMAAPAPSFTYQGFLGSAGSPADGLHFFSFRIYAAASGGTALATYTPGAALTVDQGYFSTVIDHSGVPALFADGQVKYLDIQVKKNAADAFTTLTPRQPIHPAPMAQNIPNLTGSNNTFTGTNTFNGAATNFAGLVNLNGPNAQLNVASDQAALGGLNGSSAGGTWFTLRNQRSVLSTNDVEQQWNLIATGIGNSEGPRKFLLRDATAQAVRLAIDSAGNVGIGTTNPQAKLEVVTGGTHSLRFTHEFVPVIESVNTNTSDALRGYLRMKSIVEIHPRPDGSAAGKLDVRNTSGTPTITLDGGNGQVSATTLSANTISSPVMPAAGGVQTARSIRDAGTSVALSTQENRNIDVYSFTAPANGMLLINASIQASVASSGRFHFKLMSGPDNTATQFTELSASGTGSGRFHTVIPITWLTQVTGGQQLRLFTNAYNESNSDTAFYYAHSLTALFVPNSL